MADGKLKDAVLPQDSCLDAGVVAVVAVVAAGAAVVVAGDGSCRP